VYRPIFRAPGKIPLWETPFKKLNLENLMINDRVLTSQEWYGFMDFVTNLVVENMTKNTTL
jgi:hypothetical protein